MWVSCHYQEHIHQMERNECIVTRQLALSYWHYTLLILTWVRVSANVLMFHCIASVVPGWKYFSVWFIDITDKIHFWVNYAPHFVIGGSFRAWAYSYPNQSDCSQDTQWNYLCFFCTNISLKLNDEIIEHCVLSLCIRWRW